jgi:hypothetical protein
VDSQIPHTRKIIESSVATPPQSEDGGLARRRGKEMYDKDLDDVDLKALKVLRELQGLQHDPVKVRTYEVTRSGKNGDYTAVVRVYDQGPHGEPHARFMASAFNEDTDAGTSSSPFSEIESALESLHWEKLD